MEEQIKPRIEEYVKLTIELKEIAQHTKEKRQQVKQLKEEITEFLLEHSIDHIDTDAGIVSVKVKKSLEPLTKELLIANLTKEFNDQIKAEQFGERITEREKIDKPTLQCKVKKL